jgi:hypothetical protein
MPVIQLRISGADFSARIIAAVEEQYGSTSPNLRRRTAFHLLQVASPRLGTGRLRYRPGSQRAAKFGVAPAR